MTERIVCQGCGHVIDGDEKFESKFFQVREHFGINEYTHNVIITNFVLDFCMICSTKLPQIDPKIWQNEIELFLHKQLPMVK